MPARTLLAAAVLAAVPLSAQELPAAAGRALAAQAASAKTVRFSCRPLAVELECLVEGVKHAVTVAPDAYRAFPAEQAGKLELLETGSSPDHQVYYAVDAASVEGPAKVGATLDASYVQDDERIGPRATPATCSITRLATPADYYSLTGELNLSTQVLTTSRGEGPSPRIKIARGSSPVDERCGRTAAPLKDNLDYYVTPRHYWGEDILQLPTQVLGAGSSGFQANLHLCQYDGEWHASEDVALYCDAAR